MACTIRTKPILPALAFSGRSPSVPRRCRHRHRSISGHRHSPATCLISATNLSFGTYAGAQTDATST
jgi:hypothetical protein